MIIKVDESINEDFGVCCKVNDESKIPEEKPGIFL